MDGSNMADRGTTKSRMGLSGENEKHGEIKNPRPHHAAPLQMMAKTKTKGNSPHKKIYY
jgi:hypothetical protein